MLPSATHPFTPTSRWERTAAMSRTALLWAGCRCRNWPYVEAISLLKSVSRRGYLDIGKAVWSFVADVRLVREHLSVVLVFIALVSRIILRIGWEGRCRHDLGSSMLRDPKTTPLNSTHHPISSSF